MLISIEIKQFINFYKIQAAATTLVPPSIHFSTVCFPNDFEMGFVISRTNALKDFEIFLIVPHLPELIAVGELILRTE